MNAKQKEIFINVFFWALMIWTFVYGNKTMDIQAIEIIDGKEHKVLVRNYTKVQAALLLQVFFILFFYIEVYLIGRLKKPKSVQFFIVITGFLVLVTLLSYAFAAELIFPQSDSRLLSSDIAPMLIFYTAAAICYGFTKKWIANERDKKELELMKNKTELSLLRQQLQPHFLFNTMNNLLSMVDQSDNPKLAQGIGKLSELLRYVVYNTQDQKVELKDEVLFLQSFAELQLLRYEKEEIDFELQVIGDFQTQPIEPGIFLCYVENAFKHGVRPEEKAFIKAIVDIRKKNQVTFTIENSIPKQPIQNEEGGYGISANSERLNLVYPDRHSISISEESTYKVELLIQTDESYNS